MDAVVLLLLLNIVAAMHTQDAACRRAKRKRERLPSVARRARVVKSRWGRALWDRVCGSSC
jgi:hypothetical protein